MFAPLVPMNSHLLDTEESEWSKAVIRLNFSKSVRGLWHSIAVIGLATPLLSACAQGERPFLTARVCLPASADVNDFIRVIQKVAASHHMRFFDRTAETRAESDAIAKGILEYSIPKFVLNIGALAPDGMGVTASQLDGAG